MHQVLILTALTRFPLPYILNPMALLQVSKMGVTSVLVGNGVNLGAFQQGLTMFSQNANTAEKNLKRWRTKYSKQSKSSQSEEKSWSCLFLHHLSPRLYDPENFFQESAIILSLFFTNKCGSWFLNATPGDGEFWGAMPSVWSIEHGQFQRRQLQRVDFYCHLW